MNLINKGNLNGMRSIQFKLLTLNDNSIFKFTQLMLSYQAEIF